jgi:hypothetical protein
MLLEINFDMDGTIADFYGVENWLQYLTERNPLPYEIAKPLVNMSVLARRLNSLQRKGYKVNIISWLSKCSDNDFDNAVMVAKVRWLRKHLPSVHWDNINIVRYGTPKNTIGCGILFDDEEPNRKMWGEGAYDVHNILEILKEIENGK